MKATARPKRDRTLELPDGRTLAYSDWGDLDGRPVVHLHGQPGSRLLCPDEDATEAAGVRLITVDRPGWGRSDPSPGRTMLSWVDDFVELADHIGLPPCPVLGWSGGGPYALACAYRAPERVTAVGLAQSLGLMDEVPGYLDPFPSEYRDLVALYRRDRVAASEAIKESCAWYVNGWRTIVDADFWEEPDHKVLARPDVREAMQGLLQEGARQGAVGFVEDWIADIDPGFSITNIQQETHVWLGDEDDPNLNVNANHLIANIPRSTLVTYAGEAHLIVFDHWAAMLAALV